MDDRIPYSAFDLGAGAPVFGALPEEASGLGDLRAYRAYAPENDSDRGALPDMDPGDPTVGRWAAVVLEADANAAQTALAPLLDKRQRDGVAWSGAEGTPGLVRLRRPLASSPERWLRSLYEATDSQPPHYLLLLGGPERFPFAVEEALLRSFAVGRLDVGDEPGGPFSWDAVLRYAKKVVRFEEGPSRPERRALVYSFATDEATRLSHEGLALPFRMHQEARAKGLFRGTLREPDVLFGDDARTGTLVDRLQSEAPALVLTVSHGIEGAVPPSSWGALTDVSFVGARGGQALSAAALPPSGPFAPGAVIVAFACWSGGVPEVSQHRKLVGEGETPILGAPFVPALPRALLARDDGPVAFLGHVDRATSLSFAPSFGRAAAAPFCDLADWYLGRGEPLGKALETLREVAQKTAGDLVELIGREPPNRPPSQRLVNGWLGYHDRAGFTLLGDPAIRLAR